MHDNPSLFHLPAIFSFICCFSRYNHGTGCKVKIRLFPTILINFIGFPTDANFIRRFEPPIKNLKAAIF